MFLILHQLNINWGLGIGDWGLGIGDWGLGPIPNPHLTVTIYLFFTKLKKQFYFKLNKI